MSTESKAGTMAILFLGFYECNRHEILVIISWISVYYMSMTQYVYVSSTSKDYVYDLSQQLPTLVGSHRKWQVL